LGGLGGVAVDPTVLAAAMIQTRDGIVGHWTPPTGAVGALNFDDPDNLQLWEPWVRASIIDIEVVSRLGFSTNDTDSAYLWSLNVTPSASPPLPPPTGTYQPLVYMRRPTQDIFKKQQLIFLDTYADLRGDRAAEILSQIGGAVAFLASIPFFHPSRTPWTLELLAAALRMANFVEMRFKQALSCRRPNEYSPQVQPMILTPSHGTLPMGHATEAFMSAYVLWSVLRDAGTQPYKADIQEWGTQLMRLAARVAVNRIVAGVHFPVDAAAGMVLGLTLGQYFVKWCELTGGSGVYSAWNFDGTKFDTGLGLDGDFHWTDLFDPTQTWPNQQLATVYATKVPNSSGKIDQFPLAYNPILDWLWQKALAEWV
jgi:membrane-associated phospholipid phosphatase